MGEGDTIKGGGHYRFLTFCPWGDTILRGTLFSRAEYSILKSTLKAETWYPHNRYFGPDNFKNKAILEFSIKMGVKTEVFSFQNTEKIFFLLWGGGYHMIYWSGGYFFECWDFKPQEEEHFSLKMGWQ